MDFDLHSFLTHQIPITVVAAGLVHLQGRQLAQAGWHPDNAKRLPIRGEDGADAKGNPEESIVAPFCKQKAHGDIQHLTCDSIIGLTHYACVQQLSVVLSSVAADIHPLTAQFLLPLIEARSSETVHACHCQFTSRWTHQNKVQLHTKRPLTGHRQDSRLRTAHCCHSCS